MVESTPLLRERRGDSTEGSNPSRSAIQFIRTDFASSCVCIGIHALLDFVGVACFCVFSGLFVWNPCGTGQISVEDLKFAPGHRGFSNSNLQNLAGRCGISRSNL